MLPLARALATALVAISTTAALGQNSPAHFWLSTSNSQTDGAEAPVIGIGNGAQGNLYVWGRPRKSSDLINYDSLANFSLNLVTEVVGGGTPAIDFLDDQIDVYNEDIPNRRFEYDRDSTPQDCDPSEAVFVCVPQMDSEVQPDLGVLPDSDEILNIAGYSIDSMSSFPGIGGGECEEANYCFFDSLGEPAWLIASIGYRPVASGETNVYLQIGNLGMNHVGETSALTTVRFGVDAEPMYYYSASSQRNLTHSGDSPDARISSALAGDFSGNGIVGDEDYTLWKSIFGSASELPGSNGNGSVDAADYTIWRNHFGAIEAGDSASFVVPEPTTAFISMVFGVTIFVLLTTMHRCSRSRSYRTRERVGVERRLREWQQKSARYWRNGLERPSRKSLDASLAAALMLALTSRAGAQTEVRWVVADGNWNIASNWDSGSVPEAAANQSATIDNSGIANILALAPNVVGLDIDNGTVTVIAAGSINVVDDVNIAASGTLMISGATAQLTTQAMVVAGSLSVIGNGSATVNDVLQLETGGVTVLGGGGSLVVNAYIQAGGQTLIAGGTLDATTAEIDGGILQGVGVVTGNVTVGANGTLNAGNSGMFRINGHLTNFNSGNDTLSVGTYAVMGTLRFTDAHIVTNSAHLSMSGPGSAIVDELGADALTSFSANMAGGTFALFNDRDLSVSGSMTNAGAMTLSSSTLTVAGTYTQTGGFTELDNGELEATTIDLQNGTLRGRGTAIGNLINSGRIAPGFSPEIIVVDGDYTQASDGVLDMEIGGTTTAGTDFDQLQVTGTATLAGRLDLRRINGYIPEEEDEVSILTAGSVANEFDSVFFPNAPDSFAVELLYSATDVRVKFVAPEDVVYEPTLGVDSWSTTGIWNVGASPKSKNNVTIASDGSDRLITVDVVDAKINRATVSGTANTMTLEIPTGTTLSAINRLTIANLGVLKFDGGSVVSNNVTVQSGGTLSGSGTIVGNLTNSGTLSPGFSVGEMLIDGGYTQTSTGTLAIEIDGMNPVEFDTIDITGNAQLGGTLLIDASELTTISPGTTFTVLTANSLMGTEFDDLQTIGSDEIYFVATYTGSGAEVYEAPLGDMNHDNVRNDEDVSYFALALADSIAYQSSCEAVASDKFLCDFGNGPGDLDGLLEGQPMIGNGTVDFDDIDDFAYVIGLSPGAVATAIQDYLRRVPEPSSILLILLGSYFVSIASRCRQRSRDLLFASLHSSTGNVDI